LDPFLNPFAPGAGSRPPELAGRDPILEQARISCRRSLTGRHVRFQMLLGLRGTGKTVLLNEIQKIGREEGLLTSKIEAPEGTSLAELLVPEMRKVLRSLSGSEKAKDLALRGLRALRGFASILKINLGGVQVEVEPEPGVADSGQLEFDLPDLFDAIGEAAQAAGKGWLILIDEVQYLAQADLSALIVSLHQVSQNGHPIVFVGAGLPQVAKLAGDAKSYAERLFAYPPIGPLDEDAAALAVERPIKEEGAAISEDALADIVERTQGYPFFLQEWAAKAWDHAEGPEIDLKEVQESHAEAIGTLDQGFFKVRVDRLTKAELEFVNTMARLGDGPYSLSDIAKVMDRKLSSLGPTRANIIRKGMIYSTDHGFLDFTVPLFAEFLRRQMAKSQAGENE